MRILKAFVSAISDRQMGVRVRGQVLLSSDVGRGGNMFGGTMRLLFVLLLALVIASCGGGNGTTTQSSGGTPTPTPTPTANIQGSWEVAATSSQQSIALPLTFVETNLTQASGSNSFS